MSTGLALWFLLSTLGALVVLAFVVKATLGRRVKELEAQIDQLIEEKESTHEIVSVRVAKSND